MKNPLLLTVLTLALSSSGAHAGRSDREVIGLWKKSNDWHHSVFLRRADGTYREKGLMLFDPWKPPVAYESTGDWQLRGQQYSLTARSWSEPTFKRTIGKTYKHQVRRVEERRFLYVSTDDADEEEQRIGDASDAGFERASVDPFLPGGGLDPRVIRRVKKAARVTP